MKHALLLIIILGTTCATLAQTNFKVTNNSAGGVRLGMTLTQARTLLRTCKLQRGEDGEGLALVDVICRRKTVMSFYADESNRDAGVNWQKKISYIWVWDKRYKTPDGVHPKMLLRDAERILGKIKEILMTQTESREYVSFRKTRKGIQYRTYGGRYVATNPTTKRYELGSEIHAIEIGK